MKFDPQKHHRRSIRLKGYDYSMAGAYYVTIVTHDRKKLFGEITDGVMRLNDIGNITMDCWNAIPKHHPGIELDEFVIMPNHVHGIIVIADNGKGVPLNALPLNAPPMNASPMNASPMNASTRNPKNRMSVISPHHDTLSVVIRTFKAAVTTTARRMDRWDFGWQRNYWEHIVRNEDDLNRIREYIINNPFNLESDENNPERQIAANRFSSVPPSAIC